MAKRMGRPKKKLKWDEFDKLCAMQCTAEEVAAWFDCSVDTIERAVKLKFKRTFAEVFREKRKIGNVSLRRSLFQKALDGQPAIAIFLAKNYLGMKDKIEQEIIGSKDPQKKLVIQFEEMKNAIEKGK